MAFIEATTGLSTGFEIAMLICSVCFREEERKGERVRKGWFRRRKEKEGG